MSREPTKSALEMSAVSAAGRFAASMAKLSLFDAGWVWLVGAGASRPLPLLSRHAEL
jgi:hypothetical protein